MLGWGFGLWFLIFFFCGLGRGDVYIKLLLLAIRDGGG